MVGPVGGGGKPPGDFTVGAFLVEIGKQPELRDDPEIQAGVIARLRSILPIVSAEDRTRVLEVLARTMDRDPRWIERVTRLSIPEMHRALRSRPAFLQRHDDEMIYPTDGWLGAYLLYTQESEAPLGWHFWCGAALLSIVARRNFYWDRASYYLFLNQYILLLGISGLKKSTTVNQATYIFDEMIEMAKAKHVVGIDPIYRSPERITSARLLQDLSHWTKTFNSGRKDTVVFVVSDELATLLGRDVKGSDQLANLLTDIYMGKKRHRDATIIGGDRTLTNVVATCLFATTPDSARRNITENMFSEGFMGRVVIVPRSVPHGEYATPLPMDPVMGLSLAEQLLPWLLIDEVIALRTNKETTQWYEDWYHREHKAQEPQDPKLAAFWNRKPDHMFRLAGVLKLAQMIGGPPEVIDDVRKDGSVLVEQELFARALAILEDEERRIPEAISNIGAKEEARELWRVEAHVKNWCQQHHEWYPRSVLQRNILHIAGNRMRFGEMMISLQEQHLVEACTVPTMGRPAMFYKPTDLDIPKPKGDK